MARASLRLPFLITVATSTACGGTTVVDGEGTGGGGSSGTASGPMTTGGGSTSSGMIACPAEPPRSGNDECTQGSGTCRYDVACQSGIAELTFSCPAGMWELEATPCAQTFDSCPGTRYYCDVGWWMPVGMNPPSPCPDKPPSPDTPCASGSLGGVHENCGYFCQLPPMTWTVASCVDSVSNPQGGEWQYDGCWP